jgi:hypothetical protein
MGDKTPGEVEAEEGHMICLFTVLITMCIVLYILCSVYTREAEGAVRPPKAKAVRQRRPDRALLGLVRRIVAVEAFGQPV